MPKNEKPVVSESVPTPAPTSISLTPALAALALRAYVANGAILCDVDDNQAEKQPDGSVKLYIKEKDRSHSLVYVIVAYSFDFKLRPVSE